MTKYFYSNDNNIVTPHFQGFCHAEYFGVGPLSVIIGVSAINVVTCLSKFRRIGPISLLTFGNFLSIDLGSSTQHLASCIRRCPSSVTILRCISACSESIFARTSFRFSLDALRNDNSYQW